MGEIRIVDPGKNADILIRCATYTILLRCLTYFILVGHNLTLLMQLKKHKGGWSPNKQPQNKLVQFISLLCKINLATVRFVPDQPH